MEDDYLSADRPPLAGACEQFCPTREARERVANKFLSSCEGGARQRPLVKRYTRSAAGVSFDSTTLRPEATLLRVTRYLLETLLLDEGLPLSDSYGFVSDRLRAVRQDAAIQQLCSVDTLRMLVTAARYHVMVYRVAASAPSRSTLDGADASRAVQLGSSGDDGDRFDPVMNDSRLGECLGHGLAVCEQLLRVLRDDDEAQQRGEVSSSRELLNTLLSGTGAGSGPGDLRIR